MALATTHKTTAFVHTTATHGATNAKPTVTTHVVAGTTSSPLAGTTFAHTTFASSTAVIHTTSTPTVITGTAAAAGETWTTTINGTPFAATKTRSSPTATVIVVPCSGKRCHKRKSHTAAIAGGVVGGIIILLIVGLIVLWCCKPSLFPCSSKSRRRRARTLEDGSDHAPIVTAESRFPSAGSSAEAAPSNGALDVKEVGVGSVPSGKDVQDGGPGVSSPGLEEKFKAKATSALEGLEGAFKSV